MAKIVPFRAWRYDATKVRLQDVVTQPYDKISPEMQERYYGASPHNLVRIILGRPEPGDGESENAYTRAALNFQSWRENGILQQDAEPSIYAYHQHFKVPGDPAGMRHRRSGFIALGRIHDYSEKVVFRHEQTLSKPKADRLNLLRATHGHFGQIFMLYASPHDSFGSLAHPPTMQVQDEYGVEHRVWRITEPHLIEKVRQDLAAKPLLIADGHHRYETALAFRDEMRAQFPDAGPEAPWEYVMTTFVNMEAPGLVILPTHRVVHGLAGFQLPELIGRASQFFAVEDVTKRFHPDQPLDLLSDDAPHYTYRTTFLVIGGGKVHLLRAKPGAADIALADVNAKERELDVVQLHKLLLESALGMSEDDIRSQRYLSYVREAREAVEAVRSGAAQAAFLMNPVRIDQMREIAFSGGVMPQKSTDFYPKLLSGLTIYALD